MDDSVQNTDVMVGDDMSRPTITPERLKDFIRYIVQNIVTDPDQVDVAIMEDVPGSYTVHIKVAQEDKGRVIGKKGNTINALRALVRVFGRIIILLQD
jgi:predicted RNA-binding protein YlqC (UPF0109 family)